MATKAKQPVTVPTVPRPVDEYQQLRKLRRYLLDTRYATYARLMSVYPVVLDADPNIAPAYTDGRAIHLVASMSLEEKSLALRHELLHILLRHGEPDTWRKGQKDATIRNIAGDAELSNYYDKEDNDLFGYEGILSDGINVQVNNSQWEGKTAPDIYKELVRDSKKDDDVKKAMDGFQQDNPFGDCIPKGTPEPRDPQTGKPKKANGMSPLEQAQEDAFEKETLLNEILEQTTMVSRAYDGDEEGNGTVDRKEVEATTKLYASLTRYFNHEMSLSPRRTYSSPNKQSTPSLMKRGKRRRHVEDKTLVMYIDRSASMTDEKTGKADRIVENTVKRLRDVKVIKKYFSNGVTTDPAAHMLGGYTNYRAIANDVKANDYKTIAIVTDADGSNLYPGRSGGCYLEVDMAWVCAVECKATRVAQDIKSKKLILEVAL